MSKYGNLFLVLAIAGAMIACEECTKKVSAGAGQIIRYQNDAGEEATILVPEEGEVEIPCDAKEVQVIQP